MHWCHYFYVHFEYEKLILCVLGFSLQGLHHRVLHQLLHQHVRRLRHLFHCRLHVLYHQETCSGVSSIRYGTVCCHYWGRTTTSSPDIVCFFLFWKGQVGVEIVGKSAHPCHWLHIWPLHSTSPHGQTARLPALCSTYWRFFGLFVGWWWLARMLQNCSKRFYKKPKKKKMNTKN